MKPNTRRPVQERALKTKQAIVMSAINQFGENGYHKTNAISIANGAGVATGTFYIYFKNKKEVLIEIIKQFYHQVAQNVVASSADKLEEITDIRKLIHFVIQSFSVAHQIAPRLHREISALVLLDKDVEEVYWKEEEKVYKLICSFLEMFKDRLRIKDLKAASILLLRVTDEIIHMTQISGGACIEKERLIAELEDMLSRYLKKPGE